jgi:HEAT repeat protein
MKTQILTLTISGALTMAAPAFAQGLRAASADQPPTQAAQLAEQAAQAARAAKDAQTIWTPELARAVEAARTVDVTRALEAVRSGDVTRALEAARSVDVTQAIEVTRAIQDGAWSLARASAFAWEPQSDRDRELSRTQREKEDAEREKERAQREKERENSYYDQGQQALDQSRWDRAVSSFDKIIELKGAKSDAAMYWKAYAQNKLGQKPEALNTITTLVKEYPKSRYLSDAKALEVEVKTRSGGQIDPAAESDEEIKIMAISSLQNREEGIPMLQKVLQGTGSPRLKAQALFVLAQSNSPRAREVLVNIAKGNGNPDLQMRAVRYLGIHGGRESRAALAEIYGSSSDIDLKKRILSSFMQAGEKDRLLAAAQSEQNGELRATAVQLLGNMGAQEELWALYQKESSVDVKKGIIRALFTGGSVTRLSELARSEQNPELRLLAVRNLSLMGSKRTGDTLVEIYNSDKNPDIRKAIIGGLFNSNNPEALVGLARKEQDMTLKKDIVSKLSNMRGSKVATDYLLELLNK